MPRTEAEIQAGQAEWRQKILAAHPNWAGHSDQNLAVLSSVARAFGLNEPDPPKDVNIPPDLPLAPKPYETNAEYERRESRYFRDRETKRLHAQIDDQRKTIDELVEYIKWCREHHDSDDLYERIQRTIEKQEAQQ